MAANFFENNVIATTLPIRAVFEVVDFKFDVRFKKTKWQIQYGGEFF